MEASLRPAPSAIEAIRDLASAPHGAMILETLGELIGERMWRRSTEPGVSSDMQSSGAEALARLREDPYLFDLYAALRLIENAYPKAPRLGESKKPRADPVRLAQDVAVSFAPSPVTGLIRGDGSHTERLLQRVFGLFGPNGPMPMHVSEWAFERKTQHGDETLIRFADIFHHRMLSMFYRAWANSQDFVSLDRPERDRNGERVASLIGLGMSALRGRDEVGDYAKLSHAGVFSSQIRCAESLQIVLANVFHVPVAIKEWEGHWLNVPVSQQTRLGVQEGFCRLGCDAVAGQRVWDCQTRFRIVFGSLTLDQYERFLPTGSGYGKVHDLVKFYAGIELDWDIQLVLRRDMAGQACLGRTTQLGWVAWIGERQSSKDADDLVLHHSNLH